MGQVVLQCRQKPDTFSEQVLRTFGFHYHYHHTTCGKLLIQIQLKSKLCHLVPFS